MLKKSFLRLAAGAMALLAATSTLADANKLRIAMQPGITYLPMMLMQDRKLIEKHAKEAGLGDVEVSWVKMSGGSIMNESLLSGNLDLAVTGAPSFLILWDKGQRSVDVKGVTSYGSVAATLVTRNPAVKSIKDFSNKDRIAVPAAKSSVQAIILQMLAEKEWGVGQHERLDGLTISRGHADAAVAMLSPNNEITAHFAAPPYTQQELAQPGYRALTTSNEVFGGPLSSGIVYTTSQFYAANPKLLAAFMKGLEDALAQIKSNPRDASERYLAMTGDKLTPEQVQAIVTDPLTVWSSAPQSTYWFAEFMYRIGTIKRQAASWKDLFFPIAHSQPGS